MDVAPDPWIVRHGALVRAGAPVLDVACGRGRNARWFVARGHPVTAVDVDTSGLDDLRADPRVEIVAADLERSAWPFGARRFAAVVVTNYLWRALFPALCAAVDDGGWLLYETFARGHERFGKPTRPEFLLAEDELLDLVDADLCVVRYRHGEVLEPARAVRQSIAAVRGERPVRLDS